eukprot:jgi/Orpsp1_1/1185713/evm.model.c7180000094921.1
MKFINFTLFIFCNINLALSKAIIGKDRCNDQFCYWTTMEDGFGYATILGFSKNNKNTTIINIPSHVYFDDIEYYVHAAGIGAFINNEDLEEVHVSSKIDNFYLDHDAFSKCPNLKKVYFDNKYVTTADLSNFSSPNKDISFFGRGVKVFANDQAAKLIEQWGFTEKNYYRESDYTRKVDLFELAKYLTQYLRIDSYKDSGSAIVALKNKFASYDGYARLFRILAIAMGVPENYILVASDSKNHFWNYCFIDNVWYNVDITYFPFKRYSLYYQSEAEKPFFLTTSSLQDIRKDKISTEPSQWVVLYNNYGYPDEIENGQELSENFDVYLKKNKLGNRI